jgi:phenylacetate-CoA ligase
LENVKLLAFVRTFQQRADHRAGYAEPVDRLARLNALLKLVAPTNAFQRERVGGIRLAGLDELPGLPLTHKDDLIADQAASPPFGTNLTFPVERYTHVHQTSGATGATLRVLDTHDDWAWWELCLSRVLEAAGIGRDDRVALAYSFGPYVHFWATYAGVGTLGAMVLPLGGMDSVQRLETMHEYGATALACTPSYALHLANIAERHGLAGSLASLERVVCAGEPGASIPAVRERIETALGVRCLDHAGSSEAGAFARPCDAAGGLHLAEDEFICELVDPHTREPVPCGGEGELVVTALGRVGFPVIRYATGDIVDHVAEPCPAGHPGRWLPRGILGRTDDMVVIRGMNVFPSAIEQILRESPGVGEFRITFYADPRAMDEIKVEVELAQPLEARAIQARLRQRLGLRVRIVPVKPGILPPQLGKARRVVDLRPRPVDERPEAEREAVSG